MDALLPPRYAAVPSRWWVLAVYSYASGLQGLLWMTYSSVPATAKEFLSCGDSTLDLLLQEGPIAYVLVAPFATWLFGRPGGLRTAVCLGCAMCAAAAALRCVPLLFSQEQRHEHASGLLWPVFIAQFINAAAAPLTQASPALLSQVWFPLRQRAGATGIARMSNSGGRAIGFFLGPALVGGGGGIPRLLLVTLVAAMLPLFAAICYFPAAPLLPPSPSAEEESRDPSIPTLKVESVDGVSVTRIPLTARQLMRQTVTLLRDRSVLLLAVAFGLQMGVYGAWSGVLTPVLTAHHLYTAGEAGTLGAVNTFAGIVGGVAIGWAAGRGWLATRLKTLMIALCAGSGAVFLALALVLPPLSAAHGTAAVPFGAVTALSALAGALRGGLDPLFFELSTEVAYALQGGAGGGQRIGAGAVGGLLTTVVHLVMIVFLSVPPAALQPSAMLAMAITMIVCGCLLCGVHASYVRREKDLAAP